MKITKEVSTRLDLDFNFWGGAVDTVSTLTDEEFETVIKLLEDCYPEGMTVGQLNDFFWFESDTIAEWLGYSDWEEVGADR